jgi:hypothetical protein
MTDMRATPEDVYHAYRLMLGREPDEGGYAHFCALIEARALSALELSWEFMYSDEFRRKQGVLLHVDSGAKPEPGVITLGSKACTQADIESAAFRYWSTCLRDRPGMLHRKPWEWCFIAQALYERGVLAEGRRGLGFAVGKEPLSALFASLGCHIVASDIGREDADKAGWSATNQHASSPMQLNSRGICADDVFAERVTFREADMRRIPADLRGFDFIWSACALEHLGGLKQGMEFVLDAMDCLAPGGVAVHTTELNCESDRSTVEHGQSVIYRRRDLHELAEQLHAHGHSIEPLDFGLGETLADHFVDEPPYNGRTHLKLRVDGYVTTSFGIIARKGGASVA